MNFCTECGNKLSGGEKFCSQCGNKLKEQGTGTDSTTTTVKSEAAPFEEESVKVKTTPVDIPSEIKTPESSNRSLMKRLLPVVLKYILLSVIVLGPGVYFYKSYQFLFCSLWSFAGAFLVFFFPYRKRWPVNLGTTIVPALAVFLASFLFLRLIGMESRGDALGDRMYDIIALISIGTGALIGFLIGLLRQLKISDGRQWCPGLLIPGFFWGLAVLLTVGVATVSNAPYIVFYSTMGMIFAGSGLTLFFIVLCIRRYLLPASWSRTVTVGLAAILMLSFTNTLFPFMAHAQGVSAAEQEAFKSKMMPLRKNVAKLLDADNWWVSWNMSGGFNRNNFDFRNPSIKKALLTLELGTQGGSSKQSGESIPLHIWEFQSESAAAAEMQHQLEQFMLGLEKYKHNSNIETRNVDSAYGIQAVYYEKPLVTKSYYRFKLMMQKGNVLVMFPDKTAGEKSEKRLLAALRAIHRSLGQAGSTTPPTTRRDSITPPASNSGTLSSDLISGRSTGDLSSTEQRSYVENEVNYNPEWHGNMGYADTGFIREHKGSETSGIVGLVLLGASFLTALGSAFLGSGSAASNVGK